MLIAVNVIMAAQATPTAASTITDPTKPPPGFQISSTGSSLDSAMTDPLNPPKSPLILTSLFLMDDKPYALVDGIIVRPGDSLAEGKVSKIDANGIWLRVPDENNSASSLRQIRLLPDVVKTLVKPHTNAKPKKQPKPRANSRMENTF